MDKLAMEEAGFKNCVSVPDGAPPKVSEKAMPSEENVFFYLILEASYLVALHLLILLCSILKRSEVFD